MSNGAKFQLPLAHGTADGPTTVVPTTVRVVGIDARSPEGQTIINRAQGVIGQFQLGMRQTYYAGQLEMQGARRDYDGFSLYYQNLQGQEQITIEPRPVVVEDVKPIKPFNYLFIELLFDSDLSVTERRIFAPTPLSSFPNYWPGLNYGPPQSVPAYIVTGADRIIVDVVVKSPKNITASTLLDDGILYYDGTPIDDGVFYESKATKVEEEIAVAGGKDPSISRASTITVDLDEFHLKYGPQELVLQVGAHLLPSRHEFYIPGVFAGESGIDEYDEAYSPDNPVYAPQFTWIYQHTPVASRPVKLRATGVVTDNSDHVYVLAQTSYDKTTILSEESANVYLYSLMAPMLLSLWYMQWYKQGWDFEPWRYEVLGTVRYSPRGLSTGAHEPPYILVTTKNANTVYTT